MHNHEIKWLHLLIPLICFGGRPSPQLELHNQRRNQHANFHEREPGINLRTLMKLLFPKTCAGSNPENHALLPHLGFLLLSQTKPPIP